MRASPKSTSSPALHVAHHQTPIGMLEIRATDSHLVDVRLSASKSSSTSHHPLLHSAMKQLDAYFAGKQESFTVPIAPSGTNFQRKTWKAMQAISYGKTASYAQLAKAIGKPGAARAVGSACRLNPLLLVVPCHRVVGSNGNLGGFNCGLPTKKRLLKLEHAL